MVLGANTPFTFIGSNGEPTTRPIRRVDRGIADLLGLTGESAIGRFPGPLEVVGEVLQSLPGQRVQVRLRHEVYPDWTHST